MSAAFSIPNSFIAEFVVEEGTTLRDSLTQERIIAKEGFLEIPSEPGLSVHLNEEALNKYLVV